MKSGFVAVVGKPNTGKSTLINALTGRKVSIVSKKSQTTRFKLRGILNRPEAQIIFVDTPGFHQARDALGTFLNSQVTGSLKEVDLILFLVDGSREITDEDRNLAAEISKYGLPCLLAITKKDLCREEQIESIRKEVEKMVPVRGWVSLSAVQEEGLEELVTSLSSFLPEGPALYPEDLVTDLPLTIQAAEIIREKILHNTRQEVPHSVAVEVLKIEEKPQKNLLEIQAEIYVEKDSQKKIIIGREGTMIKKIGTLAREELEYLTGKKVFLALRVKVKKKWKEKEAFIKQIYRS
ncbi:MAG: GTPase Era [Candidatus Saccharicenans sp.]|jgi:GTP-binding protein Era|nr:GTPase Era [Candidatus Saccharicenans sp.]MDH7492697.1 GTPase Era [Candidatus Saccharicenans sp.]